MRSRRQKGLEGYLLAGRTQAWWTVALSIMATQASAITFLSTPGQAYADGMRFVQFYFGLPLAMVILCVTVVPLFHRLKVYTAYEYLEGRFDLKTRTLTAFLFLLQRGLACGLTIYAPALILSVLLGWSIQVTTVAHGRARRRLHDLGRGEGGQRDADPADGHHPRRDGRRPRRALPRPPRRRRLRRRGPRRRAPSAG